MNQTQTTRINIAEDFSRYPAGRFQNDGAYSGEKFRNEHLVPALKQYEKVSVIFDGVAGFGTSFLEEAFAGLVRHNGFSKQRLECKLFISTNEPELEDDVRLAKKLIKDASEAT